MKHMVYMEGGTGQTGERKELEKKLARRWRRWPTSKRVSSSSWRELLQLAQHRSLLLDPFADLEMNGEFVFGENEMRMRTDVYYRGEKMCNTLALPDDRRRGQQESSGVPRPEKKLVVGLAVKDDDAGRTAAMDAWNFRSLMFRYDRDVRICSNYRAQHGNWSKKMV